MARSCESCIISGTFISFPIASIIVVLCCIVLETRRTANCSVSATCIDMIWARFECSCVTARFVWTSSLARMRTEFISPRFAASRTDCSAFFCSRLISETLYVKVELTQERGLPRICRSTERVSPRNEVCHLRTSSLGSCRVPKARLNTEDAAPFMCVVVMKRRVHFRPRCDSFDPQLHSSMDVARKVAEVFSAMEAATKVAIFAQPDGADSIAAYGILKVCIARCACGNGMGRRRCCCSTAAATWKHTRTALRPRSSTTISRRRKTRQLRAGFGGKV